VDAVLEQSSLYGELQPGDRIVALNGERINIRRDLDDLMHENGKNDAVLTVKRDGKKIDYNFTPVEAKRTNGSDAYLVGFTAKVQPMNLFGLLREGYFNTVYNGKLVFKSLKMLISGQAKVSDVSGPVGVVGVMNDQAQSGGFLALLFLASFISVNIGIMNLLPLPALDGGRIFFVLIEAVRRKPIPPEKEGVVHFIGIVLLLGFMVFVTWNDIMKLFQM
jgi:regulator of sigma E protease